MANIPINAGETYFFGRSQGNTIIIDSTDHSHAEKKYGNQVEIRYGTTNQLTISGSSNVTMTMQQSSTTGGTGIHTIDMNGRSQNFINMGLNGSAGTLNDNRISFFGYNAGNKTWALGQDMSDGGNFKLYRGSGLGTTTSVTGFNIDYGTMLFEIYNGLTVNGTMTADDKFVALGGNSYTGLNVPANHGVSDNTSNSYCFRIYHDGNNSDRYGMEIIYGTDGAHSGTNYAIGFKNGDNSIFLGSINSTGTTVSYSPFTGTHQGYILESDDPASAVIQTGTSSTPFYPAGSIIVNTKTVLPSGSFQPDHYIVTSSAFQDKRVFGVYWSAHSLPDLIHQHSIAALGDGMILVCDENGNIESGDYITTASGSGGHGCKQNDDLLHNYTVAKACEDVDWATEPSTKKLISCTYHCG